MMKIYEMQKICGISAFSKQAAGDLVVDTAFLCWFLVKLRHCINKSFQVFAKHQIEVATFKQNRTSNILEQAYGISDAKNYLRSLLWG